MKKIMMILVVLVQTTLFAQSKQTIEKPLKLSSVAFGTLSDNVLLRGVNDKVVKRISVDSLLAGRATVSFVMSEDSFKASINSPTFTGSPKAPTQTAGNNTTAIATTEFVTMANNLKANLASPTFTGTPTLPTGTVGVTQTSGNNSTALSTTAFVYQNSVLLAGNQTKTGLLSFTNTGSTQINGINFTNNGTAGSSAATFTNNSTGVGFQCTNSSTSVGFYSINSSTGSGLQSNNLSTGKGIYIANNSTGLGLVVNNTSVGTGIPFTIQKNAVDKLIINDAGQVTSTAYNLSVLNTAPATATATGTLGEIRFTPTGIFICTSTNTWIKCVGATF
jgi:hypothetical protein